VQASPSNIFCLFYGKRRKITLKPCRVLTTTFYLITSQKEKEVCKQINGKLMLAHPPEKRAPVIYKIKKNFQTQKNNKKNIKKNYTFFFNSFYFSQEFCSS